MIRIIWVPKRDKFLRGFIFKDVDLEFFLRGLIFANERIHKISSE